MATVLTGLSGCPTEETDSTTETDAGPSTDGEPTASPTTSPTDRPPDSPPREADTPPGTPADSGPAAYLPESTDEWEFRGTHEHEGGWTPLGASDGIIGEYRGPDETAYEFVVMDTNQRTTVGTAGSLAAAGWQVAIPIDEHAIAASTGTEQRTFTHEKPPQMTQSPVPETDDRVRELLALSPRLTKAEIDEHRVPSWA